MSVHESPTISVVIGSQDARATVASCLASVVAQARSARAEVLLIDASKDGTAEIVAARFPDVRLVRAGSDCLVPQLWAEGIARARAPLVALTTAHCIPADDWLSSILRIAAEQPSAVGFGGPIDGPRSRRPLDWAIYFSRYSAYMPPVSPGPVADVAGDNAAYRRAALAGCHAEMADGFWETIIHRRLRADGHQLYLSPTIRVRHGPGISVRRYAAVRYRHGRHYGATRPTDSGIERVARILSGPLLLPFLALRTDQRVARHRPDWRQRYLRSLPWLLPILGAWTVGEVTGYLRAWSVRR